MKRIIVNLDGVDYRLVRTKKSKNDWFPKPEYRFEKVKENQDKSNVSIK